MSVFYSDKKKEICLEVKMEKGVPQGNPMSTINFNLSQVKAIDEIKRQHPDVHFLSFHDDHYFVGECESIFRALVTFDAEMTPLGLERAAGKSKFYDHGESDPEASMNCFVYDCEYIPKKDGLIVVGVPVGSDMFIRNFLQTTVERIGKQLNDLRSILLTPNGKVKRDAQTIYQITRLCIPAEFIFLLRTCNPDLTQDAAVYLDTKIETFLLLLFNADQYVADMNENQKQSLLTRLHLKLSHGGMGITSLNSIRGAAYVGSMALSLSWINKIIPNLIDIIRMDGAYIRSIESLSRHLDIAKQVAPTELAEVSIDSMILRRFNKIQKIINNAMQKGMETVLSRSLPQGPAIEGNSLYISAALPPSDQEQVLQHMVNKNPTNYSFLVANPAAPLCGMSNEAFTVSVQHRLLLPIGKTYTHCKCGSRVGPFFSHCYRCPVMDLRNPIRNALHKELKIKIASIIKHRIGQASLNCTVLEAEPLLRDHYAQRQSQNIQLPVNVDAPEHLINANGVKVRADLAIHHHDENRYRIVDFSFTEPTSTTHLPYNKVGQAAERQVGAKLREYQHWDLDSSEDRLTIFSVETFGIVSK
jgi:hypothetical protein